MVEMTRPGGSCLSSFILVIRPATFPKSFSDCEAGTRRKILGHGGGFTRPPLSCVSQGRRKSASRFVQPARCLTGRMMEVSRVMAPLRRTRVAAIWLRIIRSPIVETRPCSMIPTICNRSALIIMIGISRSRRLKVTRSGAVRMAGL